MSPQIVTFGLMKSNDEFFLIQNMILMVFKLYVDKSKASSSINLNTFFHELIKVKHLEKGAAFNNKPKREMFLKLLPIRTITL